MMLTSRTVRVSIPHAVWIACNHTVFSVGNMECLFQYRKRYGLHAMPSVTILSLPTFWFQYRKRYGLHAICRNHRRCDKQRGFNTASGMDCMQSFVQGTGESPESGFNTASGMDCMQLLMLALLFGEGCVSIPQAVWIACNLRLEEN